VPDGRCRRRAIIDPRKSATRALPNVIEDIERKAIERALTDDRYNKTKAAAQLGSASASAHCGISGRSWGSSHY
jgi:transcriptional regulator with PAS, ATPase and Fis domain